MGEERPLKKLLELTDENLSPSSDTDSPKEALKHALHDISAPKKADASEERPLKKLLELADENLSPSSYNDAALLGSQDGLIVKKQQELPAGSTLLGSQDGLIVKKLPTDATAMPF